MDNRISSERRPAVRPRRPACRHALRRRVRKAHRATTHAVLQPVLRLVLPAHPRPEASLRELAANGATPRQMLWGIWWWHTLPALARILAAAAFGTCVVGELRGLL